MKKIGEVSTQYNISNRMLRYYEEKGIISSFRGENNYRYYDDESELRIKQICLLKKLDFSTKEIDQVFCSISDYELINILYIKRDTLKYKIDELNQLSNIIKNFISLLTETKNPFFKSLEISLSNPNKLFKGVSMEKEVLRIISLPPMKVASFKAESESPENDAHELANAFIKKYDLKSFRHFGFNNPNPAKGNPIYGYEIWITVDKDYDGETIKEVNGGLYASLTTNMGDIYENWRKLNKLVGESEEYDYHIQESKQVGKFDFRTQGPNADGTYDHQWLEEITDYEFFSDPNIDFTSKQLDLLMPIIRK